MKFVSVGTSQSLKTATDSKESEVGDSSKKIQRCWHWSIDRKHTFLCKKFEVDLYISFKRKFVPKKSKIFT